MLVLTIATIVASACPPGAAWWMPHQSIHNNNTVVLPMAPHLRIACCSDVLGAVPLDKTLVTYVWPHRGWLYAILSYNTKYIECPPASNAWKDPSWSEPHNPAPTPDRLLKMTQPQGYATHPDTNCAPYKTLQLPLEECIKTCNATSECTQVSILTAGLCGLCSSSRHRRESAGSVTYMKNPQHGETTYGNHHPLIIVAVVVSAAVVIAIGATVYSSKDT